MITSEKYTYNSVVVAKYIVAYANSKNIAINITKTQKLLYIAYGIYLAVKDGRLTDEHPQAWPYGPVFPTTRNYLLRSDLYSIALSDSDFDKMKDDDDFSELISLVFNTFGGWNAAQLTEWSHSDGSPWEKTISSERGG